MTNLENISLNSLAPDSITADGSVSACISGIDPELRAAAEAVEMPALFYRLEDLTSGQLDHMARYFDAPTWRDSWDLVTKRSMIKSVVEIKRHQGTLAAVRQALSVVSAFCTVTEWWQTDPKGTPHTFTITVTPSAGQEVTDEMQEDIIALINAAKPARSHFDFVMSSSWNAGSVSGAAVRNLVRTRLEAFENENA